MDNSLVKYLGRMVPRPSFRAYVYAQDGSSKLVESYDAYQDAMASGVWFETIEDASAIAVVAEEAPKRTRKSGRKETAIDILESEEDDECAEQQAGADIRALLDDSFLPKESA